MKNIFIFSIVFLSFLNAKSQERGDDQWGSWLMVFTKNTISNKFSIHAEVQYRTYEFGSNFNQLLLRTGLNYHFSENATVTLGYGYIPTDPTFMEIDGEENITENRIYQEFTVKNLVGKFKLGHRYRVEQRFINNPISGNDTQHRMRYLLRVTYPINEKWFLTAYDEIFANLQEPIFGQNRLYGAVGYNFSSTISMQLGYLKNHFTGINFDRFQLGFWINTNFRKKLEDNIKG